MDHALTHPVLTLSDAAVLLAEALPILGAFEVVGLGEHPNNQPLPRGLVTCGEAYRLIPALVLLLMHQYPSLNDEETFLAALRDAHLHTAAGALN
jgi:hypothetical protein